MKEIYIYHHLGLGDHIICNAIVRHYSMLYDKIYLFVKQHNYKNVKFMYGDLKNINYLIGDDSYANDFVVKNHISNIIKIGFDKLDINNYRFDESFYKQIGLDFEKKWTNFYLPRNMDVEMKLFESLGIKENEYIFTHDLNGECSNRIESDLKIIQGSKMECGLFDMCYIIENANQIHLMESSIKCLIDHLNIKTEKLYYHRYIRGYQKNIEMTSKMKWVVYN